MMNKKTFILFLAFSTIISLNNFAFSKDKTININNNSLSPEILKEKANQAAKKGDYKKASELFRKLVSKFPKDDDLRVKLSYVLLMNNNKKEASEHLLYISYFSKNPQFVAFAKNKLSEMGEDINDSGHAVKGSSAQQGSVSDNTKKITKNNTNEKVIELVNNPEDHYLCSNDDPTIFEDQSGNTFRRWEKSELPIKVYIPSPPREYNVDSYKYIELVKKGMNKWPEKAPGVISFAFVSLKSSANVEIVWHDYFRDESAWGEAFLPVFDEKLNKKTSALNLAVKTQPGTGITKESVYFSDNELLQIIMHETGHVLGIAHSYSQKSEDLMAPFYRNMFPGQEPYISDRDIKSLKKLYSFPEGSKCICK